VNPPEFIDLERLEAQPWKNGAGATREIAVHPAGAGCSRAGAPIT